VRKAAGSEDWPGSDGGGLDMTELDGRVYVGVCSRLVCLLVRALVRAVAVDSSVIVV